MTPETDTLLCLARLLSHHYVVLLIDNYE